MKLAWRDVFSLRTLLVMIVFDLCAILPTILALVLWQTTWTHTEPPWSWLLVSVMPVAGLVFAIARDRLPQGVPRLFALVVAVHATMAAVSLWMFALWPAVMSVVLAIDALLLLALLPSALAGSGLGLVGAATFFWIGLWFGVGILAAFGDQWIVVESAEAIAGDRPYCILTASQKDPFKHELATSLFDLNALKMRARLAEAYCSAICRERPVRRT